MIISHVHKCVFIKTLKTAGTNIEVFLSQQCGPDDVVTPILPHVEPHRARNHEGFFNHMPAHAVRKRIDPAHWNSYFKFCVERNPWDKTLSHFHMRNWREGSLGVNAKSEYRSDRRAYREVFQPEQAAQVGESFRDEILLHGYVF